MALLKTDGTKMKMDEVADLLSWAAVGGEKPEEVSWSAWLAALERIWQDAEAEVETALTELRRVENRLIDAKKARDFHNAQYFDAKTNLPIASDASAKQLADAISSERMSRNYNIARIGSPEWRKEPAAVQPAKAELKIYGNVGGKVASLQAELKRVRQERDALREQIRELLATAKELIRHRHSRNSAQWSNAVMTVQEHEERVQANQPPAGAQGQPAKAEAFKTEDEWENLEAELERVRQERDNLVRDILMNKKSDASLADSE